MAKSILDGKRFLAVDDEPDVLEVLEEEILGVAPNALLDKATSYQEATNLIKSRHYDLVILDIMGVRGFDLLDLAVNRNLSVAMLTAHSLNPESLKRSFEMKARTYLPKDKLGEIVPFLEDVLEDNDIPSGWIKTMKRLDDYFDKCWGKNWEMSDAKFFQNFDKNIGHLKL
ncbi:MAG: response regulator [Syntrophaceae bacterium]|nr:response regulator [Syntrophaceae bacterium]